MELIRENNEKGASIVEFSLVSLLLLIVLLVFADFARYVFLQTMLTRGAQQGLKVATKTDGLVLSLWTVDESSDEYQKFTEARDRVTLAAHRLPDTGLVGGGAELYDYVFVDSLDSGDIQAESNVILLLPGDMATVNQELIVHPTVCPENLPPDDCPNEIFLNTTGGDSMERLLRVHPMVVELRTTMNLITPFLGPIALRGNAVGYRELPPLGSFPEAVPPPDEGDDDDPGGGNPEEPEEPEEEEPEPQGPCINAADELQCYHDCDPLCGECIDELCYCLPACQGG